MSVPVARVVIMIVSMITDGNSYIHRTTIHVGPIREKERKGREERRESEGGGEWGKGEGGGQKE